MLVLGIALWLYNAISSGASVFGSSYLVFLAATKQTDMSTAYLLMGFGLVLSAVGRQRKSRNLALSLFVLWSLPALLLGLRGEVIIPATAYLIVAARRRFIRPRAWMFAVAIVALAAGSAIRVLRLVGDKGSTIDIGIFNPLDGLKELGGSIRPLVVMINYHDQYGEPFVGMSTYLAPFRRLIVGRILGGQVTATANDPFVFSTMIAQRVGQIGGSPAAEAYRSGGVVVMVVVLFLIGFAVASLDSLPNEKYPNCLVGMLSFIVLFWVRNDFTPVPADTMTAFVVLATVWIFEHSFRPKYGSINESQRVNILSKQPRTVNRS